jgi:hypothetical protein
VLVAPETWINGHRVAADIFDGCHAIEGIAKWLDTSPSVAGEPRRLRWRADALRKLTMPRETGVALDDEHTIAFSRYCVDWLASRDSSAEARPNSLHTANQGWLWFAHPPDLAYKATHGLVDLYAKANGFTSSSPDDLASALEDAGTTLPEGFSIATDTSKHRNVVIRREVPRLIPSAGVPDDRSGLDEALGACALITHWLDELGGLGPRE